MVQFVNTFFLIVALISALLVVDVHNRNQVEANTLEKLKKEATGSLKKIHWSIVDLQCCDSFFGTAK